MSTSQGLTNTNEQMANGSNVGDGDGGPTVLSLAECSYLYSNYRKRSSLYNLTDDDPHVLQVGAREFNLHDTRYDVLSFDQVRSLNELLEQQIRIKTDVHEEMVQFSLMKLIISVRDRLRRKGIILHDIRLNGGAASHVLSLSASVYNDIDLIFFVDLKTGTDFEVVRESVFEVLVEFIPSTTYERRHVIESFVNKMVKVSEIDRWSLFSLLNNGGRNVELKFVDSMRRQYEFSVDSFQIVLDTMLQFCTITDSGKHPMTFNFYPTVVGESMYGNFCEAIVHLHHRLIVTKNPEEIRGGGLLKYCSLLVRNYYPIDEHAVQILEPYMCTRFLIDFIYYECQQDKLRKYMNTHFGNDSMLKYNFMVTFLATIRRSSSLAAHHAAAMQEFERLLLDSYATLLLEYLHLYFTDYSMVQDFFQRCQDIRICHCPKHLHRSCIHRHLNSVYSITSPLVVSYVDDESIMMGMNGQVDSMGAPIPPPPPPKKSYHYHRRNKEERKHNLRKFIEVHDEQFPSYGGFTFAFLPAMLFDCVESNHYVVSSSTLKNIPSARFIGPDPISAHDCMATFLMTPGAQQQQPHQQHNPNGSQTNEQQQQQQQQQQQPTGPILHIIPLTAQDLLPKSFYPIDYHNPSIINPGLVYHFFPPIAPPPAYRLCIVNRIPIYLSEPIDSGPIFNSQIMAINSIPPAMPTSVNIDANSKSSSTTTDSCTNSATTVSLSQFNGHNAYQPIEHQTPPNVEPLRIVYPRNATNGHYVPNLFGPIYECQANLMATKDHKLIMTTPQTTALSDRSIPIPQISINDNLINLNTDLDHLTEKPIMKKSSSSSSNQRINVGTFGK
ncbi:hypothetical protein RDWZM_010261 [Blomia tropicalis]|uniref:polynucleotide adenylyltransferase n=1 Tax=Blomia tropicalis TaxID=40697 RepID=A0A9Q0LYY0_BLOTA|nr:hypothetical protein RDWZM_010261 [Blomia tropicalis]